MYDHIQRSPINLLLHLPAVFVFFVAWSVRDSAVPGMFVLLLGVALLLLSLCIQSLRVSDQGEYLDIRFGPLNLYGTKIAYRNMTHVEQSKTSWIDGWGIHFIPFRGWTLNLWGFDCVTISRGQKTIRIGSDDSENLVRFLQERLQRNSTAEVVQNVE